VIRRRRRAPLLARLAATTLFTGYFPFAPGTVGSLVAAGLFMLAAPVLDWWGMLLVLAGSAAAGFHSCVQVVPDWGGDPSRVTIDEFVGCWLACIPAWYMYGGWGVLAALVLFRIFDILKPWPVSALDRRGGPASIMLDDLAAGVMAAAVIALGWVMHAVLS